MRLGEAAIGALHCTLVDVLVQDVGAERAFLW